ncbi:hypothetical protein [Sulfitobacter phage vB_SupP_AX]|nr:hypothetical protein [Sulfitobacter phage vB_SupP_AX]
MSERKIYIAGPMSGIPDHNKPAFIKGEEDMISLFQGEKFSIFNPINHEASLMVQTGQVRDTQEAYRMCMAIDCEYLCKEATDIYMLKGWENSKGAMAEWTLAKCLGLNIIYE